MKYTSIMLVFISSGLCWTACSKAQKGAETAGATEAQIEEAAQKTKPYYTAQMPGTGAARDSFLALKVYLKDGRIVADSTWGELVYGKLNTGTKTNDFRIETKDANGKVIGAIYTDNVFRFRSCDEGTNLTGALSSGWIDIFVPFSPNIESIDFVEQEKSDQQISIKNVRENMRKWKRGKF